MAVFFVYLIGIGCKTERADVVDYLELKLVPEDSIFSINRSMFI
jgi:hypothetical protein